MSSDCFGGFLDQIITQKKYSHLAIGCNVWGVGSMSSECCSGFVAMFFGGFLDQITNYDQKKTGTVIWHWLECLLPNFDLLHPRR